MSKVLAIRFSALGDIAMAVPVLVSAARLSPDDEFTMLSRDYVGPLFSGLAPNIKFHGVDLKRQRYAGLTGMMNLYRGLKAEGFDKVVDLHDVLRTKQLRTFFSLGGAKVSHIDKERSRRRALVRRGNKRLVQLKTSFRRYADAFAKVGLATDDAFTSIYDTGRPDAPQLLPLVDGLRGRHWIGVAPFTTHKGKELPLPTTRKVVEELAASESNHVFLFGAGKHEIETLESWAGEIANTTSVAGKLPLGDELLLMSKLDCMVSMDSANMHLASLVATPVVSVWGATHPYCGFFGWKQPLDNAVQLDMDCRPCSIFGQKPCRFGTYDCLERMTPGMLLDKIRKVIKV